MYLRDVGCNICQCVRYRGDLAKFLLPQRQPFSLQLLENFLESSELPGNRQKRQKHFTSLPLLLWQQRTHTQVENIHSGVV